MPAPIPTLGYPSRMAAAVALRERGLSTLRIIRALGIDSAQLCALEHAAARVAARRAMLKRAATAPAPALAPEPMPGRAVLFPPAALQALAPHAKARGVTPNEVARRIVEAAVDGDMVTAILDDGVGPEGAT